MFKSYQITIGNHSRMIMGLDLKDAIKTASWIKKWNNYKGKTTVKYLTPNQVFDILKSL